MEAAAATTQDLSKIRRTGLYQPTTRVQYAPAEAIAPCAMSRARVGCSMGL